MNHYLKWVISIFILTIILTGILFVSLSDETINLNNPNSEQSSIIIEITEFLLIIPIILFTLLFTKIIGLIYKQIAPRLYNKIYESEKFKTRLMTSLKLNSKVWGKTITIKNIGEIVEILLEGFGIIISLIGLITFFITYYPNLNLEDSFLEMNILPIFLIFFIILIIFMRLYLKFNFKESSIK
jgi:hypothetical protein